MPLCLPALWRIHCWALWAFARRAYVAAMSRSVGEYRPRAAEHAVLYRVIDEQLDAFLEATRRQAGGVRLPAFVEQEFYDFLTCGILAHGFARLRCTECALERLVPFSCMGRGFCPSCGGRRMTERAARMVDGVLPRVPTEPAVPAAVLARVGSRAGAGGARGVRARGFQRHRARRYDIRAGRSGSVTVIRRFGGGLNLNVHFHTLLLDGVFFEGQEGALEFRPLPPPTDDEIGGVLARIAARVQRLLWRRRLAAGEADGVQADPLVDESPASSRHQQRLGAGADRVRPTRGGADVASGGRSRRAVGAVDDATARAPGRFRSARQRRAAGNGSRAPGAAVSFEGPSPVPSRPSG